FDKGLVVEGDVGLAEVGAGGAGRLRLEAMTAAAELAVEEHPALAGDGFVDGDFRIVLRLELEVARWRRRQGRLAITRQGQDAARLSAVFPAIRTEGVAEQDRAAAKADEDRYVLLAVGHEGDRRPDDPELGVEIPERLAGAGAVGVEDAFRVALEN